MLGESLFFIRERKKRDGTWMEWLKTQPYSATTANNSIKLFQRIRFEDLESCKEMTISDLKASLGIIKEIPVKRRGEKTTPTPPEKCDRKVTSKKNKLKLVTQDEIDTTPEPDPEDQPQTTEPPDTPATDPETPADATEAQPQSPASPITPTTAMTYLHMINIKLTDLERELKGMKCDEHLLAQIDNAIKTLQRIRGYAATDAA